VVDVVRSGNCNGYTHFKGALPARQAIVDKYSHPDFPFSADDVWITPGTHMGLFMSINVLCGRGDNILVPRPAFPLVKSITQSIQTEIRFYDLKVRRRCVKCFQPEEGWSIDLESVKRQIDHRTRAFMVINPSNPCGAVFTREHQLEIIQLAEEYKVPILSDEVYYGIVHEGHTFTSLAYMSKTVPMIVSSCSIKTQFQN